MTPEKRAALNAILNGGQKVAFVPPSPEMQGYMQQPPPTEPPMDPGAGAPPPMDAGMPPPDAGGMPPPDAGGMPPEGAGAPPEGGGAEEEIVGNLPMSQFQQLVTDIVKNAIMEVLGAAAPADAGAGAPPPMDAGAAPMPPEMGAPAPAPMPPTAMPMQPTAEAISGNMLGKRLSRMLAAEATRRG